MSETASERRRPRRQKVPAFARYQGTSAWRKHRRKVRAYEWFRSHQGRQTKAAAPAA